MITFAEIDYAPVEGGGHTSFGLYILNDDPKTRIVFPFPASNWEITTKGYQEEMKKVCKQKGFEIRVI